MDTVIIFWIYNYNGKGKKKYGQNIFKMMIN